MDHHHAGEQIEAGDRVLDRRLNIIVWVKSNAGMGSPYRSKHGLVFVYRSGSAPHRNNVELGKHGRSRSNVWEYGSVNTFGGSRRDELALHPTCKPIKLVSDALQDVTAGGDIVLDGFLGSGTTVLAAAHTGRTALRARDRSSICRHGRRALGGTHRRRAAPRGYRKTLDRVSARRASEDIEGEG
jgi:DNA modification methylase